MCLKENTLIRHFVSTTEWLRAGATMLHYTYIAYLVLFQHVVFSTIWQFNRLISIPMFGVISVFERTKGVYKCLRCLCDRSSTIQ